MAEVILDALKDSLIVFPFVFLIYVIMEIIESAQKKEKIEKALSGTFAPVVSGGLGIIPECGFSVMCAKLYENGLIRLGTLITAFLCTSDEGLVVLISNGVDAYKIAVFVVYKAVYAIIVGILINALIKKYDNRHVCPESGICIECGEKHEKRIDKFFLHPLSHAGVTFLFITVLNVIFGSAIALIGEANLEAFMLASKGYQPLLASILGLVPNCSSSIIISQAYVKGLLSFPALVSGLSTNAGLGILILFKNRKGIKRNIVVLLILYFCGLLGGYITFLFGI